jgi:eukaryotic-like serine/threonine-protein kinase
VQRDRGLQVADFGVARTCSAPVRVTNTKHVYGKVAYMAPEQCSADDDERMHTTDRADVWALAATLLEAWSGAPPYSRAMPQQIFSKHYRKVAPSLDVPGRPLPPALRRVLTRCLDFDAAARPSAAELRQVLLRAKVRPGGPSGSPCRGASAADM